MCEALLEFPEGWGVLEKIPSMGKVWICSGTTPWKKMPDILYRKYNCIQGTFFLQFHAIIPMYHLKRENSNKYKMTN